MRTRLPCVVLLDVINTDSIKNSTRPNQFAFLFTKLRSFFSIDLIINYRQNIELKRHSCYSVSFTFFCV